MRECRLVIVALTAMASAIACVMIFTSGLVDYKKSAGDSDITATGLASCGFELDLIVWRDSSSIRGNMPKGTYSVIREDTGLVKKYLEDNQVSEDKMVFSSISTSQKYTSRYDDERRYLGGEPDGYELAQTMTVSPCDIDKTEVISRDISALIEVGVELESSRSGYYYIKLDEMKLDLIEKAATNAKRWVGVIASGTGGTPGTLLSANLGVFQVTVRNFNPESCSHDGALNTSSRLKTAMITVRLNYSAQ